MRRGEWTKRLAALGYPTRELFEEEKARIVNLDFDLEELTVDHIVFALERAFGLLFKQKSEGTF